jgi:2-polyprenyl-3-methyl-5-hydroxy-6-metoxy-1,4-benzoquinol methylase
MSVMTMSGTPPSPELFFDTLNAYQRTAALKTAIELDLFTALADGPASAADVARKISASERGTRILLDYLTLLGFLRKANDRYELTRDSAMFLSRRSPAYVGGAVRFLGSPGLVDHFDELTDTVRRGARDLARTTVSPDNPVWIDFARAMVPLMVPAAEGIADLLEVSREKDLKVLDIAAGHGVFGVTVASKNPVAQVYAVDSARVLDVARENATRAGVADRFHVIPGDAFAVEYGTGYHLALVTNFLHHFDAPTNVRLLRKIRSALAPDGRVALLEFVPNEDRVSPAIPAAFAMIMLGSTPSGDAYTFAELRSMLEEAGFSRVEQKAIPMSPETLVSATK